MGAVRRQGDDRMRKRMLLGIAAVTTLLGLLLLAPTRAAAQCCDKACVDLDHDGLADDSIRCPGLILGGVIPNPLNLRGCEELDPGQVCIGGRLLPPVVGLFAPPPPPPDHQGLLIAGCVCDALTGTCRDGSGVSLTPKECALAAAQACGASAIRENNDSDCDPCLGVHCDDGNACTADSCSAGECVHVAISCDDGDACTADTCDPATGCSHATFSCDDNNPCTTDTCDPDTGCVHSGNCPAVCGNGVLEAGEQCDDGNTTNGDGCSSTCTTEGATGCCGQPLGGQFGGCATNLDSVTCAELGGSFVAGGTCVNDTCTALAPAVCGNGMVEAGEQCDDGNTINGDGCSSTCTSEAATGCCFGIGVCVNGASSENCAQVGGIFASGGTCGVDCEDPSLCGNGVVNEGEQCDDGNTTSGDGCSSTCTTETTQQGFCCTNSQVAGLCAQTASCADCTALGGDTCSATTTCSTGGPLGGGTCG